MNQLSITTTQNVNINFTAASVGDRIIGQILDMLVQLAYIISVSYLLDYTGFSDNLDFKDSWSTRAVYIMIFSPVIIYSLLQESLWEGRTIGKKIMKIKVIKIDGYQAGFGDYLIRWLFRTVDVLIGSGIIGLIFIATSKKNQRLGDIAAGTAVISLKNKININHTILQELHEDYVPIYPEVIKLSDNDMRIIKDTFETCLQSKDFVTISKMRKKIIDVTGIKYNSNTDVEFMRTVLKDYNFYTRNM
ncbi:RDD family protein [Flavobacterium sp. F372]|uniref:RDD family protein n=1 Tax=Flavobacterium bernardetii TaxID=2813823 RepID=A0ABR7IV27_9FLAO|nr:RDD family protein [Flavobacterium bernardetii]MBC5833583.1 RDD family protein [Flavobacterium bernardetii]NHF68816.1 RDD family protein [Flavobacterium bernardetii]